MKYLMFLLFASLAFASIVVPKEVACATEYQPPGCPNDITLPDANVSEAIITINNNIDQIPDIFVSLFGNERMSVYVDDLTYAVVTENNKLVSVSMGEAKDKTMNVYVSRDTLHKIVQGDLDPVDALNQGLIRYEGVGFVNSVKWTLINVVAGIVGFFANLFG